MEGNDTRLCTWMGILGGRGINAFGSVCGEAGHETLTRSALTPRTHRHAILGLADQVGTALFCHRPPTLNHSLMTSIVPEAEPVVLAGNVAPAAVDVGARDVLPSIAVLHFGCLGSRSESEHLVAQTDTEYRFVLGEELTEALDGGLHHGRIAWSVRDEQPVELFRFLDKVVVSGDDAEFNTTFGEAADLVVFHAHIDNEDA